MRSLMMFLAISLLAASCAGPKVAPTPAAETPRVLPTGMQAEQALSAPAVTMLPATATQDYLTALVPEGVPAREWMGIPIMPGAIKGDGDVYGYSFTTQAKPEEIGSFYQKELAELGWQYLPYAEGDTGTNMMVFRANGDTLIISVYAYQGEGMLVVIAR
jgi:hypothetical protein